jgi:predicted ATP-grasp superfamily ATP-dependent carboligase
MDALVTDAQIRAVVAGIRGLGRGGLRVLAASSQRTAAGRRSRFASERAITPESTSDPAAFAATVGRLASEHGPLVVYPGREEAIDAIVGAWSQLPPEAVLPYPSPDALNAIRDKPGLAALAEPVGLRAPATLVEATAGELAAASVRMPYVVKPGAPVGRLGSAHLVESVEGLTALLKRRSVPDDEPVLVQERARGPLTSVELVLGRDGAPVARFQQLSRETWPVAAGSISFATSVSPDETLIERAAALLAGAGYWGLAQVDVVETASGPAVVDVNPRFYSCLPLAMACGVNLPIAWHAVATGRPLPPPGPYRVGVSFRWLEGDFAAAARGMPRRLLRRTSGPTVGAMWTGDDPVPGLMLGVGAVALRIRRILGRATG